MTTGKEQALRIVGADIGGTFTDIVLVSEEGVVVLKVLSTPADYSQAVVDGVAQAAGQADVPPESVSGVMHATTIVTNALLEDKGVKTGLLTTAGFRDVLEIARLRRPTMYDLNWSKPRPLVPRGLRREVRERLDAQGDVVEPLDTERARQVISELVDEGVESIAICLLNSYANPVHERLLIDLVHAVAPHVHVSASVDVLAQIREFERTSTTCVNATVAPVVDRYVARLEAGLADLGVGAQAGRPPVMLMQSNGGVVPSAVAAARPVTLIESGPAAGALAGAVVARLREQDHVIGLDIGGTTAKAFLVEHGQLRETGQMEIGVGMNVDSSLLQGGGYTVAVPSIDLAEVGAGGGSIARVDAGGALKVGPESAGSSPGPACYGLGGTLPTVTDAFAVLGFFSAEGIAGGSQPIDGERARAAIDQHIATRLGCSVEEAAWGIHLLNTAAMIRAVRAVTSERGRDPRTMEVVAFGGAGPVQAAEVLRQLGGRRVVVPPLTGVFSSFGLLLADLTFDFQRSIMRSSRTLDDAQLADAFAALEREARVQLSSVAIEFDELSTQWGFDMRYEGQSSELGVYLPSPATLADALEAFGSEHVVAYGYRDDATVEIVGIRVRARRLGAQTDYASLVHRIRAREENVTPRAAEPMFFGDRHWETRVYARSELTEEPTTGPLVVREYDSTVVVPPGMIARLDHLDNILIEPAQQEAIR